MHNDKTCNDWIARSWWTELGYSLTEWQGILKGEYEYYISISFLKILEGMKFWHFSFLHVKLFMTCTCNILQCAGIATIYTSTCFQN
jgi:hypothetical protein